MSSTLLALLLAYAGMAGLALAMVKHYRQIWNHEPSLAVRRTFRAAGYACLAAALAVCITDTGASIGTVTWFALLFVSSIALVFLLSYVARTAILLAAASVIVSLAGVLLRTVA